MSRMTSDDYPEGYWERGEGSNYYGYSSDPGWVTTARIVNSHLPKNVLEIGCAKGYFVSEMRYLGADCVGIDISEYAIAKSVTPLYTRQGTILHLPWKDDTFDTVCSWEVLEHVYEDELDAAFGEMERVLKPAGTMFHRIGMLINGEDESSQADDHTHYTVKDRSWWEKYVDERGWYRNRRIEGMLDQEFEGRDWQGRFIVGRL